MKYFQSPLSARTYIENAYIIAAENKFNHEYRTDNRKLIYNKDTGKPKISLYWKCPSHRDPKQWQEITSIFETISNEIFTIVSNTEYLSDKMIALIDEYYFESQFKKFLFDELVYAFLALRGEI